MTNYTCYIIILIASIIILPNFGIILQILSYSFVNINKEFSIEYDKTLPLKLLKEFEKEISYNEKASSDLLLFSKDLNNRLVITTREMVNPIYENWIDFVKKGKDLGKMYGNAHYEMEKLIEHEKYTSNITISFLIKKKKESNKDFFLRLKRGVKIIEKHYNSTLIKCKQLGIIFDNLYLKADELLSESDTEQIQLDDLIKTTKKGWSWKEIVLKYGTAALALGIPGSNIIGGISTIGMVLYHTYDTQYKNPELEKSYKEIKQRYILSKSILDIGQKIIKNKIKILSTITSKMGDVSFDLNVMKTEKIYISFVEELISSIKSLNVYSEKLLNEKILKIN